MADDPDSLLIDLLLAVPDGVPEFDERILDAEPCEPDADSDVEVDSLGLGIEPPELDNWDCDETLPSELLLLLAGTPPLVSDSEAKLEVELPTPEAEDAPPALLEYVVEVL